MRKNFSARFINFPSLIFHRDLREFSLRGWEDFKFFMPNSSSRLITIAGGNFLREKLFLGTSRMLDFICLKREFDLKKSEILQKRRTCNLRSVNLRSVNLKNEPV